MGKFGVTDDGSGLRIKLGNGAVTMDITNPSGEPLRVVTKCNDDVIDDGHYGERVFSDRTKKGECLNRVEDALEDISGVDAGDIRSEAAGMLSEAGKTWADLGTDVLPSELQELVEGTHYPIHVYVGDPTEWVVTITAWGETHTLTFTTSEIQSGAQALETKVLNEWVEFIDVTASDWETIRDEWKQHIRKHEGGLSEDEALAEVLVDHLRSALLVVDKRSDLANDKANVWIDETNDAEYDPDDHDVDDEPIAWVRNDMVREAHSRAGGEDKRIGEASKALQKAGVTYGPAVQRQWGSGTRRYYPFVPTKLDLDRRPQQQGDAPTEESEVML